MPLESSSYHGYSSTLGRRTGNSDNRWRSSSGLSSSGTGSLFISSHALSGLENSNAYGSSHLSSYSPYLPPRTPVSTTSRNLRSTTHIGTSSLSPAMSKRDELIGSLARTSKNFDSHDYLSKDAVSLMTGVDPMQSYRSISRSNIHSSRDLKTRSYSRSLTTDFSSSLTSYSSASSSYRTVNLPSSRDTFRNAYRPIVIERPSISDYVPRPQEERRRVPARPIRRDRPIIKFRERDDLNPSKVRHMLNAWVRGENLEEDSPEGESGHNKRDSIRSNDSGIGSVRSSRRSRQKSGDFGDLCLEDGDSSQIINDNKSRSCKNISVDEGVHFDTEDECSHSICSSPPVCSQGNIKSDVTFMDDIASVNVKYNDGESPDDIPQGKKRVRINFSHKTEKVDDKCDSGDIENSRSKCDRPSAEEKTVLSKIDDNLINSADKYSIDSILQNEINQNKNNSTNIMTKSSKGETETSNKSEIELNELNNSETQKISKIISDEHHIAEKENDESKINQDSQIRQSKIKSKEPYFKPKASVKKQEDLIKDVIPNDRLNGLNGAVSTSKTKKDVKQNIVESINSINSYQNTPKISEKLLIGGIVNKSQIASQDGNDKSTGKFKSNANLKAKEKIKESELRTKTVPKNDDFNTKGNCSRPEVSAKFKCNLEPENDTRKLDKGKNSIEEMSNTDEKLNSKKLTPVIEVKKSSGNCDIFQTTVNENTSKIEAECCENSLPNLSRASEEVSNKKLNQVRRSTTMDLSKEKALDKTFNKLQKSSTTDVNNMLKTMKYKDTIETKSEKTNNMLSVGLSKGIEQIKPKTEEDKSKIIEVNFKPLERVIPINADKVKTKTKEEKTKIVEDIANKTVDQVKQKTIKDIKFKTEVSSKIIEQTIPKVGEEKPKIIDLKETKTVIEISPIIVEEKSKILEDAKSKTKEMEKSKILEEKTKIFKDVKSRTVESTNLKAILDPKLKTILDPKLKTTQEHKFTKTEDQAKPKIIKDLKSKTEEEKTSPKTLEQIITKNVKDLKFKSEETKYKTKGVIPKAEGVNSKTEEVKLKSEIKYKFEKVESKNEELKPKNEELKLKNEELKPKKEEAKSKTEGVKSKIDEVKLKSEVKSKFDEVKLKSEVKSKFDEIKSKTDEIKSKTDEIKSKTDEIKSKTDEIKSKTDEIKSKTDEIKSKTDEIKSKTNEITEEIKPKMEEVRSRTEGVKSKTEEVKLKSEIKTKFEEVKSKTEEVKLKSDIKTKLEEVKSKTDQIKFKNEEIKFKNEEIKSKNEEIKSKNEEIKYKNEEIKSKNEDAKSKTGEIKSKAEEVKFEQENLKTIDQMKSKIIDQVLPKIEDVKSKKVDIKPIAEDGKDNKKTRRLTILGLPSSELQSPNDLSQMHHLQKSSTTDCSNVGNKKLNTLAGKTWKPPIPTQHLKNLETKDVKKIEAKTTYSKDNKLIQENSVRRSTVTELSDSPISEALYTLQKSSSADCNIVANKVEKPCTGNEKIQSMLHSKNTETKSPSSILNTNEIKCSNKIRRFTLSDISIHSSEIVMIKLQKSPSAESNNIQNKEKPNSGTLTTNAGNQFDLNAKVEYRTQSSGKGNLVSEITSTTKAEKQTPNIDTRLKAVSEQISKMSDIKDTLSQDSLSKNEKPNGLSSQVLKPIKSIDKESVISNSETKNQTGKIAQEKDPKYLVTAVHTEPKIEILKNLKELNKENGALQSLPPQLKANKNCAPNIKDKPKNLAEQSLIDIKNIEKNSERVPNKTENSQSKQKGGTEDNISKTGKLLNIESEISTTELQVIQKEEKTLASSSEKHCNIPEVKKVRKVPTSGIKAKNEDSVSGQKSLPDKVLYSNTEKDSNFNQINVEIHQNLGEKSSSEPVKLQDQTFEKSHENRNIIAQTNKSQNIPKNSSIAQESHLNDNTEHAGKEKREEAKEKNVPSDIIPEEKPESSEKVTPSQTIAPDEKLANTNDVVTENKVKKKKVKAEGDCDKPKKKKKKVPTVDPLKTEETIPTTSEATSTKKHVEFVEPTSEALPNSSAVCDTQPEAIEKTKISPPETNLDDLWFDYIDLTTESTKMVTKRKSQFNKKQLTIKDFHLLKVLGRGSYGKVVLAELKNRKQYYAIKCLKKHVVLDDNDVECTMIEKEVLAMGSDHPYLCTLYCSFQSESQLFFVMEYLSGGDLMFHIQQLGRFDEDRAR